MNYNDFTSYIEESILQMTGIDEDDSQALAFLCNPKHFRPFSEGLRILLERKHYPANAATLYQHMKAIGSSVKESTVTSWFAGTRRPKLVANSRTLMYQIGFALSLSLSEMQWFFHHVYYDRCFNCHIPEEAVYYFCFSHQLSYQTACEILTSIHYYLNHSTIQQQPASSPVYTITIRNQIDGLHTKEELISYFAQHASIFTNLHTSALEQIQTMLIEINGTKDSQTLVQNMREKQHYSKEEIEKCGLLIQEIYHSITSDNMAEQMTERIARYHIGSYDFMLNTILTTTKGLPKTTTVPSILRNNFPSKKVFSDILKENTNATYDAIRKVLILLHFYIFWCNRMLTPIADFTPSQHLLVYREEANALLTQCCYEELFAGNPYDWVFLSCACSDAPLLMLREMVGELWEE